MEERRESLRSPTDTSLKFAHKGLLGKAEGELQVLDLSAGGLSIRCNEHFSVGSTIEIIMDPKTIVLCKIIYKETSNYGLKFIDKNQTNVDALLTLCKTFEL